MLKNSIYVLKRLLKSYDYLLGTLSQVAGVFMGQVSDVLFGVAPVDLVKSSVEIYVLTSNFLLSLNKKKFSLSSFLQCVSNDLSILLSASNFRSESLFSGEFEQLVFPNVFGVMIISKEFSFILNIRSDDGGVRVDFFNMFLSGKIILFWVGKSVMIILNGGGEEEV